MQGRILVFLFLSVALTEGWFSDSGSKCQIKKYKSGKSITGYDLLVHEDFNDRVKAVEKAAKDCKVHVYITGSYYQLPSPSQTVSYTEADLVIGHAFKFELRDESNAVLCNPLCLSKNPTQIPEVKCFLQYAQSSGLKWSSYNSNVLSDGTYAANPSGYTALKTNIQTKCQKGDFKRALLRALRRMEEEEEQESNEENNYEDEKKK